MSNCAVDARPFVIRVCECAAAAPLSSPNPGWESDVVVSSKRQAESARFHAVEIRCAGPACEAAQQARGKRYLSSEAPLLPLAGCDRPDRCRCRYEHFDDRRAASRREAEAEPPDTGPGDGPERRHLPSRRVEDFTVSTTEFSSSLDDSYYGYRRSSKDD